MIEERKIAIGTWTRFHASVLIIATFSGLFLTSAVPVGIGAGVSFFLYFYLFRTQWKPLGFLGGPANWVTAARILGIIFLTVGFSYLSSLTILIVGGMVLAADGLDGFLARKFNTISEFGGILDKETDALYVLVFTVILFLTDLASGWIIGIGLLRYGFVWVVAIVNPAPRKETRSKFGATIAVVLMIGILSPFVLPEFLYIPILWIISGLVLFSFGRGFYLMVTTQS